MSIADSTVPSIDMGAADDIDWIDIQPLKLSGELSLELTPMTAAQTTTLQPVTVVTTGPHVTVGGNGLLSTTSGPIPHPVVAGATSLSCHRVNSVINPYLQQQQQHSNPTPSISVTNSSTLQSLLQGNLHPTPASALGGAAGGKVTQLQPRDHGTTTLTQLNTPLPPPPYSILQNRLTHGPPAAASVNSHVIKVDSTYDLMKTELGSNPGSAATSPTGSTASYLTSSYADSTQSHVTTSGESMVSDGAALQQRLSELGGLKIKKKVRKSAASNGGSEAAAAAAAAAAAMAAGSPLDPNAKKMMHHCQICHRGFLNKSNIKVHLRTHTGEKPFQCEHCSKAFRQKAHLLKHMSIHKRISRD